MSGLVLLARCDQGGLANQTHALWGHLRPYRTIVVHMRTPRGVDRQDMYDAPWTETIHLQHAMMKPHTLSGLLNRGDTLLSAETFYTSTENLRNTHRVLVANPELYNPTEVTWDTLIVPTEWESERMPAEAVHVPYPTPQPPTEFIRVREAVDNPSYLHVAAPAMLDRNGTGVVLDACRQIRMPCSLYVRAASIPSPTGRSTWRQGHVQITWDDSMVENWWENYPVETDAFILPRRYGGLCLPAQEAAACGLPLIMPDLAPNTSWPGPRFGTAGKPKYAMMKGGRFPVHHPCPAQLSTVMTSAQLGLQTWSADSLAWADSLSWENISKQWTDALAK